MDIVIKYYECEIRKKDEEVDFWKRKFFVLQSQCVIQKELDAYKFKFDALSIELQEKKLGAYLVECKLKDLPNGISTTQNDELKYKTMCDKVNEQIEELKTRCKESVSEAELKLKGGVDLERQLKDCKAQYSEMYEELKRYKMTCDQLNEQNEEFKRRCKELARQAESRLENQVDLEKQLNEENEEFKRKCKELAAQAESRLEKQVDMEKQLNDYKAKYDEMYVRFKEGKERVAALESDLKEYMRICGELDEQVESSEDKVRATSGEAGKCIDKPSKEIVHLGDEKRKIEDESEVLKTKFRELESKMAFYLQELDDYKVKFHGLKNLALTTNAFVGELEGYKMAIKGLKEQITAEERIVYLQEVIKSLVEEKCINPISTTKLSEPSVNLHEDKGNDASLFKMKFANRANEKINLEIEERESYENDKEIRPRSTCDTGSKQRLNVSTSKRPFFDQKGEEYGINCEAIDIPLSSAPERGSQKQ
ncbi:hypothetical protein MKX01_039098 [Papaver californicum]|nr:hypothetical protein MKX01_039098 [Papaver californicum]